MLLWRSAMRQTFNKVRSTYQKLLCIVKRALIFDKDTQMNKKSFRQYLFVQKTIWTITFDLDWLWINIYNIKGFSNDFKCHQMSSWGEILHETLNTINTLMPLKTSKIQSYSKQLILIGQLVGKLTLREYSDCRFNVEVNKIYWFKTKVVIMILQFLNWLFFWRI